MKSIVAEMYECLVRMQQSPFTPDFQRREIEALLDRATSELFEPELIEGETRKLLCHYMELGIQADKPTANGRVYPKDTLKKAFEKAKDGSSIMVFMGMPDGGVMRLEDTIGQVEQLHLTEEGKLVGQGFLVQTPKTADLDFIKAMLDQGRLGFSMGGTGKVDNDGVVQDYEMTHVVLDRTE